MTINDEFFDWVSLSDMLLGPDQKFLDEPKSAEEKLLKIDKRTPAELECALEKNDWYYYNARGRIMPANSVARARALKLLATYHQQDIASKNHPYDSQPPSAWLNTDNDPGLASFKWKPDSLPKFELSNVENVNLDKIPGPIPRVAIGKLVVQIAWQIEKSDGRRASAKEVMSRLQNGADIGSYPHVLLRSDKARKMVIWITDKAIEKSYSLQACEKTLSNWYKNRP